MVHRKQKQLKKLPACSEIHLMTRHQSSTSKHVSFHISTHQKRSFTRIKYLTIDRICSTMERQILISFAHPGWRDIRQSSSAIKQMCPNQDGVEYWFLSTNRWTRPFSHSCSEPSQYCQTANRQYSYFYRFVSRIFICSVSWIDVNKLDK